MNKLIFISKTTTVSVFALSMAACAPTQAAAHPEGVTKTKATPAPLPPTASALAPGYDPFASEANVHEEREPNAANHQSHSHAAPENGVQDTAPKAEQEKPPAYVCPMHPEVTSDKPDRCPKCGMKLEPVKQKPDNGT